LNIRHLFLFILPLLSATAFAQTRQAPIQFTENKGQWDSRVRYQAEVNGGFLFIHTDGFTVLQHNESDWKKLQEQMHHHNETGTGASKTAPQPVTVRSHAYRARFEGSSPKATLIADKPLQTYNSYFLGDPANWASHCRVYLGITIKDLYPGIDVRYYSDNGSLKYDFLVNPGADVNDIRLTYEGADGMEVKDKMLNIKTSIGTIREMPPYSYQYTDKGRQEVKAAYSLKGRTIRFNVKNYDASKILVIDPTMIFASFSNSTADNWGYTATYGPDGSMFGGGIVFPRGGSFPVSSGAFQQTFAGGDYDIGIIKLTPDGTAQTYATYIGGSGSDQPHSLIVDPAGNLIIAGRTNSPLYNNTAGANPYPLRNGAADQIGTNLGGYDVIVTKLSADGSSILGSARIGGSSNDGVNGVPDHGSPSDLKLNYGDDGRGEVILDGAGNIYVAACTQSLNGAASPFPTTAGAFQTTPGGGEQDGVVLKFSPSVSLLYSSFLGGSLSDGAFVLSLHPFTGELYVAGSTKSDNFPGTSSASMHQFLQGQVDGFVAVINNSGTTLVRSTYVGTASVDMIWGIKFDHSGYPYIMGQTLDNNWRKTTPYGQPGAKQFIMKLKADLSDIVYSTPFGTPNASAPNISPVAFLVDRCENVYVSGWGGNIGFASAGTNGLPVTADALVMTPPYTSPSQTDGKDFYFFVLKKNGTEQLYGSFYGQNGGFADHVDGGTSRFDENGVIYQAICANCTSPRPYYPTTPGAYGETNPSPDGYCNMIMVKIALNLSGIKAGVQSSINGVVRDTAGCVPLTVDFRDTVLNAVSYEWDFDGDGNTDQVTTTANASYTYNVIRNYRVRLIAVDSSSCNIRDTSYMIIKVGDLQALPAFTYQKLMPCQDLKYQFNNTSAAPASKPFTASSFLWDFGDGSPRLVAGPGAVTHSYANPGPYKVRLYLVDTAYCNAPDSMVTDINIAVSVKASLEGPSIACAPTRVLFTNTSSGGQTLVFDFGDGTVVTTGYVDTISHYYAQPGDYIVKLQVTDSATCNIIDNTTLPVRVIAKPGALIGSVTPQPPIVNTPLTFTNASSADAVRFKWFFGDGDSIVTITRDPVIHEFNNTQTYEVILVAYNSNGCTDTARRLVQTLVEPALDVPNAFTPLAGGINGVVMPRGFGINKMKFVIYNRWGQKVFQSENRKEGWDGTFKGVVQPMDVYVYTLEVEFVDGTKATKKGDITLIR
jgi:gliding motility-associated-like protein